jgi:hypothetical protein
VKRADPNLCNCVEDKLRYWRIGERGEEGGCDCHMLYRSVKMLMVKATVSVHTCLYRKM